MAKKVLFINQEIAPYVAESHMSVMGRELPQKMQEAGFEIRTFMPKWGTINERRGQLHEVIRLSGMNLIIDDTDHPLIIKVASIPVTRQQIYFIDNDDYFNNRQMGIERCARDCQEATVAARCHHLSGLDERCGSTIYQDRLCRRAILRQRKGHLGPLHQRVKRQAGRQLRKLR